MVVDSPPTLLNRVNCVGTESNITECPVDNRRCVLPGAGVVCPISSGNSADSNYIGVTVIIIAVML